MQCRTQSYRIFYSYLMHELFLESHCKKISVGIPLRFSPVKMFSALDLFFHLLSPSFPQTVCCYLHLQSSESTADKAQAGHAQKYAVYNFELPAAPRATACCREKGER